MKHIFLPLAITCAFIQNASHADMKSPYRGNAVRQTIDEPCDPWYVTIGSGYAWSYNVDMQNVDSRWSPAVEGYNSDLNNASFISVAAGKTIYDWFDFESEFLVYQQFHYQKFQTETGSPFLPKRYRSFDLDNFTWLFNLRLHLPLSLEWDTGYFSIGPFAGGGVGVGVNTVSNFHTVGYSSTSQSGNYTSVGQVTRKNSLAWQANGGVYLRPRHSGVTFNVAYRYVDSGEFAGPSNVMDNTQAGGGNITAVSPWSGRLTSSQIYFFVKLEI